MFGSTRFLFWRIYVYLGTSEKIGGERKRAKIRFYSYSLTTS
jgi:hypothetical protein